MADTDGDDTTARPAPRRPRTAAEGRVEGETAPAKKAPAKKAPAKKAAAKKAPGSKAPAKKPAVGARVEPVETLAPTSTKPRKGAEPSAAAVTVPDQPKPAPERSWAQPHAATLSLPEPRPGVPITKQHVAAGGAALFGILLLRRRRKRRR